MRQRAGSGLRILVPMLLFVVLAILLIGQTAAGAGAYARFQKKGDAYFGETTFSDYVRTKVSSVNETGKIRIGRYGDSDALFLQEDTEDGVYETVLYVQNGYLMEEYKAASASISPDAGNKIMEADTFAVKKVNDHCIRCSMEEAGVWQHANVFVTGLATEET